MRAPLIAPAVLVWIASAVRLAPAASPAPHPSPTANPSPGLRLDVDRHVERLLDGPQGLLRFETHIEVVGQTPQQMLDRFFRDGALECGPTPGGAPTAVEMRSHRPTPLPAVDFLAVAQEIAKLFKKKGAERYYVYRLVRVGEKDVSYLVHDGRLPPSLLFRPGATLEVVEGFPDLDGATRAWRRLERGFAKAVAPEATPLPPWTTIPCGLGRK